LDEKGTDDEKETEEEAISNDSWANRFFIASNPKCG